MRFSTMLMGLLALGWPASAYAQSVSVDPLAVQGEHIRDRFVAAVRACGVEPVFIPSVVVETRPSLVSYNTTDRVVRMSRWSELDGGMQGLMSAWSAQGTLGLEPEGMFDEIFNRFLLAHELGHYLEHMSGRLNAIDLWESEVEANRIAIAFWASQEDEAGRLPARVANFNVFLEGLPSPVPEGEDAHAYFVTNYERLGSDAAAYGWYQGAFLRTAWAQRDERDFCGWVKANPPLPLDQVED